MHLGKEDRAANIGAVVVFLVRRVSWFRGDAILERVEGVVAQVFVTGAVELLAAALGLR